MYTEGKVTPYSVACTPHPLCCYIILLHNLKKLGANFHDKRLYIRHLQQNSAVTFLVFLDKWSPCSTSRLHLRFKDWPNFKQSPHPPYPDPHRHLHHHHRLHQPVPAACDVSSEAAPGCPTDDSNPQTVSVHNTFAWCSGYVVMHLIQSVKLLYARPG